MRSYDKNAILAVYGNWQYRKEEGSTTSKIFTIGYDIEDNVIFGTDCSSKYRSSYTREILAMDKDALDAVSVSAENREKYYSRNVLRFLGRG
ncbi:hypothetical protein [Leadbettera azotonutricia]|uniref:Uncharacterized protein n=1 Tax=Leadbettera azotonutricia (strain ATCC BAA-888 / DSM 13862 / ZAS-9) TaxID=545695 RepID=F5YFQ6_LEAAZ|nr:hypothetical protein [Leadbettera azotonutricia]AEF80837.1 hypothetical protein TREAZ_2464 [Leadbettera azotonutricia ZAS-9]